jgi:hypothetical protein
MWAQLKEGILFQFSLLATRWARPNTMDKRARPATAGMASLGKPEFDATIGDLQRLPLINCKSPNKEQ